jgi:hypothetical protein
MSVEATLSIREVMICWTGTFPCERDKPTFGSVTLIPWPDGNRRSDGYACTTGACDLHIHKFTKIQRQHFVMSTALGMIINYGIDPKVVHCALWPLKEYRDALPPDTTPPAKMNKNK